MRLSQFSFCLRSLLYGPIRFGYVPKDEAHRRLVLLTGQDFGEDYEKWREWGDAHPEVYSLFYTPKPPKN